MRPAPGAVLAALILMVGGCAGGRPAGPELVRRGDEIVVCGRYFHTGAPVILWTDPGGYDAYRVEPRFTRDPAPGLPAARYDLRNPSGGVTGDALLSPEDLERVRAGGWDLPTLRRVVDQFVIHYDAAGTSRQCFRVLHDMRGLSVHFMIDLDGTIYQTLDVKERAWHATTSNHRSVGVEMANIGAYEPGADSPLHRWYTRDGQNTRVVLPDWAGDGGLRSAGFIARPARDEPVVGTVHGRELVQFDFTPEQYRSLTRLTTTLCDVLPRIRCDYPRDGAGRLLTTRLGDEQLAAYSGLLGHWHVQDNKIDPGPAFDWDRVVTGARRPFYQMNRMRPKSGTGTGLRVSRSSDGK